MGLAVFSSFKESLNPNIFCGFSFVLSFIFVFLSEGSRLSLVCKCVYKDNRYDPPLLSSTEVIGGFGALIFSVDSYFY